jgi:hypothetical protein
MLAWSAAVMIAAPSAGMPCLAVRCPDRPVESLSCCGECPIQSQSDSRDSDHHASGKPFGSQPCECPATCPAPCGGGKIQFPPVAVMGVSNDATMTDDLPEICLLRPVNPIGDGIFHPPRA